MLVKGVSADSMVYIIGNFSVWRNSPIGHTILEPSLPQAFASGAFLALDAGAGECWLALGAIDLDVLARHLAARIDRHHVEHLDLGRERRAARLLERKHHRPFEYPVLIAIKSRPISNEKSNVANVSMQRCRKASRPWTAADPSWTWKTVSSEWSDAIRSGFLVSQPT